MQQRTFPSGSRQAPDPYDQFLEQNGFYRKHTARDASSLFRVISEQMYDTQLHHLSIRKKCVSYMQKHHKFFQALIDRDLDEYLEDMSKPKTCATLIELQAVGLLYQRNVLIFEPFTLGNYFGQHREHFTEVFRVFCTPERHFDSVYTSEFIKDAAICQSICYELLYKDLFKLPDVKYAVEIMLHNSNLEPQQCSSEINDNGYYTCIQFSDKRTFPLDLPTDTNCILEDASLCRFHSSSKKEENNNTDQGNSAEEDATETLLPNKLISCVRQLLLEGITPFPYKVAKALDPTMYRNIEFDAWNEARKELKFQNWYCGDGNFKVGAKCHVKLSKAENELYTCHIQDISIDKSHCLVFIEQLGEKRLVPYDALSPLPSEQFKPWALPYRFHRQMQKYNSMRLTRHYNTRFKFNGQLPATAMQSYSKALGGTMPGICNGLSKTGACIGASFSLDFGDLKQQQQHYVHMAMPGQQHFHNSCFYNLTHLENFRAGSIEYCTMPMTVEHNVNMKSNHDTNADNSDGSCGVTTTVPTESGGTENLDESNQVATSTVDNGSQDDSPGSREVALINHNYALEQTNLTYIPEYPTFYPMQPYAGIPEDFYGFGCEPGMNPQFGNCPNGGMYYMCNPGAPGTGHGYSPVANNFYLQAPPVQAPTSVLISPTAMAPQQYYPSSNAYITNTAPTAIITAPLLGQASTVAHTIHESGGNTGVTITTPLSGRINYDAKKSVKLNGMDLPTDMATLRYFYNLGVEAHNRRRHSQDSAIGSRDNINIKEERTSEQKDPSSSACKADANNNLPSNSNSKHNATTPNSQLNNTVKPQYGTRRFHNNHNSRYNNVRDRQPPRRNSVTIEEINPSSMLNNNNTFNQRNYHDYGKSKYQQQNSLNERHPDMSRSTGSNSNLSNISRHQQRNNERSGYYENVLHNSSMSGGGDCVVDTTTGKGPTGVGGDQADNGQIYTPYGHPPPPYEHLNDFHPHSMPPNNGGPVGAAGGGNMFIPVHVQQTPTPYSAMYTTAPTPLNGALLQPMNQSTPGCSPNYGTPHFIGHPSSPLIQNSFGAQSMNGSVVPNVYASSNPLSSNASETSGGGGGGAPSGGNGDNTLIPTQSLQPTLMSNNYGPSIPIYVTPNPTNGNTNGQPIVHHALQAPPPHVHGGGPQGFWCIPPPTAPAFISPSPAQVAHMANVGYVTNNTNHTQISPTAPSPNSNGVTQNRRTQSQQQQQTEKETH